MPQKKVPKERMAKEDKNSNKPIAKENIVPRASLVTKLKNIIAPDENAVEDDEQPLDISMRDPDTRSVHSTHSKARSNRSGVSGVSGKSGKSAGDKSNSSYDSDDGMSGKGKQIFDTYLRKAMYMKNAFYALTLHIIYLAMILVLNSEAGMTLNVAYAAFEHAGPIIILVWARVAFFVNDTAIHDAFSAIMGYRLNSANGYSIAVAGFLQADLKGKMNFGTNLSFRSTAKKLLNYSSFIFLYHFIVMLLSVYASTGVSIGETYIPKGKVTCIQYDQELNPFDRGTPSIYHQMGNAEVLDGIGLGQMRANFKTIKKSKYISYPQVTDPIEGTSLYEGHGIIADIVTYCNCSDSSHGQDLINAGVPTSVANQFEALLTIIDDSPSWVNYVSLDNSDSSVPKIKLFTALPGFGTCGGLNLTSPSVPVCTTLISNHSFVKTYFHYRADAKKANPHSVVPDEVSERYELGYKAANTTYLTVAMTHVLGGSLSYHYLPAHWPGSVNPLLWLASDNMRDISIALLSEGIEASTAYVIRAAIARSYTTHPTQCLKYIRDEKIVILRLTGGAYVCGMFWVISQLIMNAFCFLCFVPWWLSPYPMLPAIIAIRDPMYFALLLSKNRIVSGRIKTMSSNVEYGFVWARLDMILRLGESLSTVEDPDRGMLVMDQPKFVTHLEYTKTYI